MIGADAMGTAVATMNDPHHLVYSITFVWVFSYREAMLKEP
jgi:hypothetical protein